MKQLLRASNPIGIFDSGIGGFTVAKAVIEKLPREDIIYFADLKHLPYGNKTTWLLQKYALQITDILLAKHCKLILIACNSASAASFEVVKNYVGSKALVLDVINPMVTALTNYQSKTIGIIGTEYTINSGVYQRKILAVLPGIKVKAFATPLLVPAIEKNFNDKVNISNLLAQYLDAKDLQNIDVLVLACTHYPLVKQQIVDYYHNQVAVIDSASVVADFVAQKLAEYKLLNNVGGKKYFYTSKHTESFDVAIRNFFPN